MSEENNIYLTPNELKFLKMAMVHNYNSVKELYSSKEDSEKISRLFDATWKKLEETYKNSKASESIVKREEI